MATLEDFRIEYQGTLAQFKASNYPTTYADKIVHITGDSAGKDSAIFANGKYYAATDAALAALKLFDKVSAGGQTAQAAAAGSTLAFEDGDNITITLTSSGVKFSLSSTFKEIVSQHTTQLEELYERMDAEESATEGFAGNIQDLTQDIVDQETRIIALEGNVGETDDLNTTSKNTVGAINEVLAAVGTGGTNAVVTVEKSPDGLTYTIKQGGNQVGVINIPKDMVVTSGEVVTNPSGQAAGTYIKLTLANVAQPLYINVGKLVDIYTVQSNAAQIQLAIDAETRVISATIVNGSVTADKLAAGAVTTAKIADENVTLPKLATALQTILNGAILPTNVFVGSMGNSSDDYLKRATGVNTVAIAANVTPVASDTKGLANSKDVKGYVDGCFETAKTWKILTA